LVGQEAIMAQITLELENQDFRDIQQAAGDDGIAKYIQDALGLAKLVHKETKESDNVLAITDKNGKVLKTVKTK
jgi:hypothetical protein